MTVCMLIWDYWPGREGGAQRQCRKLSHALSQSGTDIQVITQRTHWLERRTVDDHDIRIVRLGGLAPLANMAIWMRKWKIRCSIERQVGSQSDKKQRQAGPTTPIWWLARLSFMIAVTWTILRQRPRPDLIHVHEANWIAAFASWLGARAGLPVVCKVATLPSLSPMGADVPFRTSLQRWQSEPHFIALNSDMADELKRAEIDTAKIHVIPNGVEIPPEPVAPKDDHDVLFIANFTQGSHLKAYDILLNAWSIVHKQDHAARLVMVGRGDDRPWRKLAIDLHCRDSVFFSGFIKEPDEFYRQSTVFVLPSRKEGMSNALLEAQSWGIPAVVSAIPGNLAVVDDGINGLVVAVEDAEALAAAILRLLADRELRTQLGNQARHRMIKDFSIAAVSALILGFYQQITAAADSSE